MGVAKWRKLEKSGKGFVCEEETAEYQGLAESPKFLPALGLFIFKKKFVATTGGKLDS